MKHIYIASAIIMIAVSVYCAAIIEAINRHTDAVIASTEAIMTNDEQAEAMQKEYCRGWQECKEFYLFEEDDK